MEQLKREILAALKQPRKFGFSGLSKPELCAELEFASKSAISEALRQMRKAGQVYFENGYGGGTWHFWHHSEHVKTTAQNEVVSRDQPKRYVFADTPLSEVKQLVIMALGHIQGVPEELRGRRRHFDHYVYSTPFAALYSRDIDRVLGIPVNDFPSEKLVRDAIRELRGDALPGPLPNGRVQANYLYLLKKWRREQINRYGDYDGWRVCSAQPESCHRRVGRAYGSHCFDYDKPQWGGLWQLRWRKTYRRHYSVTHPRYRHLYCGHYQRCCYRTECCSGFAQCLTR